jgi:Zn-dependent protease with chaperone function
LKPLAPCGEFDPTLFLYNLDSEAMLRLHSISPLNAAAHRISEGIGRPWFEAALNGVRLSEEQLPDIFSLAIRAARLIGLPCLPEIYVSGENMWDTVTLGSENSAFVSLGSVLTNMRGEDLLFVLAREMGHVRAGHALWNTITELVRGQRGQSSLLGGGILEYLNPAKLVQGAFQAPLMAWKRHSEITADRAGYLAVGKEEVAVRVLFQWAMKSFPLFNRINLDAWRRQEEESEESTLRLSEWMMTSNPYLARRLKMLREYIRTPEVEGWRAVIEHWARQLPDYNARDSSPGPDKRSGPGETVRLACAACRKFMRVPRAALEGAASVNVRCPNTQCRKVMTVRPIKPRHPGIETMTQDS